MNDLIKGAYALPADMPAAQRAEVEHLAEQLSEILDGVADPKLAKPILDCIISSRGPKDQRPIS